MIKNGNSCTRKTVCESGRALCLQIKCKILWHPHSFRCPVKARPWEWRFTGGCPSCPFPSLWGGGEWKHCTFPTQMMALFCKYSRSPNLVWLSNVSIVTRKRMFVWVWKLEPCFVFLSCLSLVTPCLCILAAQPRKLNADANWVDDFVEAPGPAVLEQKSRLWGNAFLPSPPAPSTSSLTG